MIIKKIISDKLISGTFWLTVVSLLGSFFSYLVHPILARNLTVAQYGDFQAIMALVALFSITGGVVMMAVAREVAQFWARNEVGKITSWQRRLIAKLLPIGVIIFVITVLLAGVLAKFFNISSSASIIVAGLFFVYFFQAFIYRGTLSGSHKFFALAVNTFQDNFWRFILVLLFVSFFGWQLIGASWALALCLLPGLIFGFYQFRALRLPKDSIAQHSLWPIFKYSFLVLGYTVLLQIFFNLDLLMIKNLFLPEQAGFYGSLLAISRIVFFVGGSVPLAMFPMLANLRRDQLPQRYRILGKSLLMMLALVTPTGLVIAAWPQLVVKVLLGAKYLPIAPYLPLFVLVMAALTLLTVLAQYFLALADKRAPYILVGGLIAEIGLLIFYHSSIWQVGWSLLTVFSAACLALAVYLLKIYKYEKKN